MTDNERTTSSLQKEFDELDLFFAEHEGTPLHMDVGPLLRRMRRLRKLLEIRRRDDR